MRKECQAVILAAGSVTALYGIARAQPVFLNTIATSGSSAGQVDSPYTVSVSPDGQEVMLLSFQGTPGGAVYQADGTFLFDLLDNAGQTASESSLQGAIDTNGTFYASVRTSAQFFAYNPTGQFEKTYTEAMALGQETWLNSTAISIPRNGFRGPTISRTPRPAPPASASAIAPAISWARTLPSIPAWAWSSAIPPRSKTAERLTSPAAV